MPVRVRPEAPELTWQKHRQRCFFHFRLALEHSCKGRAGGPASAVLPASLIKSALPCIQRSHSRRMKAPPRRMRTISLVPTFPKPAFSVFPGYVLYPSAPKVRAANRISKSMLRERSMPVLQDSHKVGEFKIPAIHEIRKGRSSDFLVAAPFN